MRVVDMVDVIGDELARMIDEWLRDRYGHVEVASIAWQDDGRWHISSVTPGALVLSIDGGDGRSLTQSEIAWDKVGHVGGFPSDSPEGPYRITCDNPEFDITAEGDQVDDVKEYRHRQNLQRIEGPRVFGGEQNA